MKIPWHNYRTGEYDYREAPTTDEEARDYVPQGAGSNLYTLYRRGEENISIMEALIKVLTIATGKTERSET